jgi:hypothetical protein
VFPAASEDVAAVYKDLLKTYRPENIGIYGCSAGGALTAQAEAWFQDKKLPNPGALGIFGSGAVRSGAGESAYVSALHGRHLSGSASWRQINGTGALFQGSQSGRPTGLARWISQNTREVSANVDHHWYTGARFKPSGLYPHRVGEGRCQRRIDSRRGHVALLYLPIEPA